MRRVLTRRRGAPWTRRAFIGRGAAAAGIAAGAIAVRAIAARSLLGSRAGGPAAAEDPRQDGESRHDDAWRISTQYASAPVVDFYLDRPYVDPTGRGIPYVPPLGLRSGQPLVRLGERALRPEWGWAPS